ncbi:MAG: lipocalin [Paracoccaceae bacterium]|nr:MAG: lipocalin [Paracoccaceae bacterium]
MSRLAGLILLLGLAACAAPAPSVAPFRAPAAPIYSVAAFDPARLPGAWRQVAAFAAPGAAECAGVLRIGADGRVAGQLCLNGRVVPVGGALRPAGPGRLTVAGMAPWWVVWSDEGYRTLAVGTPSGEFGFVLDRSGSPAEDRLRAAEEIFDFNGYDRRLMRRLR